MQSDLQAGEQSLRKAVQGEKDGKRAVEKVRRAQPQKQKMGVEPERSRRVVLCGDQSLSVGV